MTGISRSLEMTPKRNDSARRRQLRILRLLGLIVCVCGAASIVADTVNDPPDRTLTDTVVVLERAVSAFASPSADYRKIFQDALAALPSHSEDFVKADITTFLRRAPDAQSDFKCAPDFVRYRARKELLRLKDTLLDSAPQPARPQFCYAVPLAIDPMRPMVPIEIYGYDFDREPVQLLLMDNFGFRDVTFAVVERTHYHLTLDLQGNGVKFSAANQTIALTMGHLIEHSIPLIQPDTPLCSSHIEEIPAGKVIAYAPPPIAGLRTTTVGQSARVLANAVLDYESNKVDATVCMTAVETNEQRTAISGCAVEYVYTSDPDRLIEWVFGGSQASFDSTAHRPESGVRKPTSNDPVARWMFPGLDPTSRSTTEAQVAVRLRPIRLVSTTTEPHCVSPVTYLEARRTHALDARTVRRLDPQLKGLRNEILKVRPRFAPSIR
jgi:hypothetical protein